MKPILRFILAVYAFSLCFDNLGLEIGSGVSIPKMVALLYASAVVLFTRNVRWPYEFRCAFYTILLTFFSITFSTFVQSRDISQYTIVILPLWLNCVMFYVLLKHSLEDTDVVRFGLFGFTFACVCAAGSLLLGLGTATDTEGRTFIFGDNPNTVALRFSIAAVTCSYVALEYRARMLLLPITAFAAFILLFLASLQTGSRVAGITIGLGVLCLFIDPRSFNLKKLAVVIGFAAAWPKVVELALESSTIERLTKTMDSGDLAGRDWIWNHALLSFYKNPLFGVGYDGMIVDGRGYTSPHNVIIEVLVLSGLVGCAFYLGYCYTLFLAAYRALKSKNQLLPLLLLVPFIAATLVSHTLEVKYFYLIAAFVLTTPLNNVGDTELNLGNKIGHVG